MICHNAHFSLDVRKRTGIMSSGALMNYHNLDINYNHYYLLILIIRTIDPTNKIIKAASAFLIAIRIAYFRPWYIQSLTNIAKRANKIGTTKYPIK